ncbi:MAG: hypothetical protein ACJ71W_04520 [Terriglobales bacterium]
MKNSELALTVVGTGLGAVLCLLFIVRRFYREFPIFFASATLSVVATIILLFVSNNAHYYALVFWPSDALGVLLAFFALNEALRSVFRNFLGMKWFRWLFPGIGIVMLSAAVLRILLLPRPAFSLFTTTIIGLEIAVGFLQFGIFSLFIILVRLFHLRWGQHAAGIVFGYGVSAAGSLIAFLLRSEFGTKFDPVVRIAPPIAYIIGVAIWLATFLKAEPGRQEAAWSATLTPEQMITELKRHTETVKGILGR